MDNFHLTFQGPSHWLHNQAKELNGGNAVPCSKFFGTNPVLSRSTLALHLLLFTPYKINCFWLLLPWGLLIHYAMMAQGLRLWWLIMLDSIAVSAQTWSSISSSVSRSLCIAKLLLAWATWFACPGMTDSSLFFSDSSRINFVAIFFIFSS